MARAMLVFQLQHRSSEMPSSPISTVCPCGDQNHYLFCLSLSFLSLCRMGQSAAVPGRELVSCQTRKVGCGWRLATGRLTHPACPSLHGSTGLMALAWVFCLLLLSPGAQELTVEETQRAASGSSGSQRHLGQVGWSKGLPAPKLVPSMCPDTLKQLLLQAAPTPGPVHSRPPAGTQSGRMQTLGSGMVCGSMQVGPAFIQSLLPQQMFADTAVWQEWETVQPEGIQAA